MRYAKCPYIKIINGGFSIDDPFIMHGDLAQGTLHGCPGLFVSVNRNVELSGHNSGAADVV
jgi:hypothetical protein